MKKKLIFKMLAMAFCVLSTHAFSREFPPPKHYEESDLSGFYNPVAPFTYDLDPLIIIHQNTNEKGLVVMSGKLTKPFTSDHIKLSIKYQDSQGNWLTGWCKTLYSYNQYNETLVARFELPASAQNSYNLKIELSSDTNLSTFSSVVWEKSISHYQLNDYAVSSCDLDENEYTMLLTPKKDGSLITNSSGKVTGLKDRVTSSHFWNKLSNVLMNNKKDDVVFSPTNPSDLITDAYGGKSVKLINTGGVSDTLGATPEFIYNEAAGHPIPYLYSYDDPVYMFAGKFSANGLFIKFSQWPEEINGPGYFNWKSPTFIESRYFNMFNRTWKNLSEFIPDQQPVVIVSSITTGLRVYKNDGTYIDLTPNSTSNYGAPYFGYTNNVARRGPGSENLIISNTSEMTLYGVGALRNDITTSYLPKRTMQDVEKEIFKFIKYTRVFGATTAYDDTSECSHGCFTVNANAVSDYNAADWAKAPNSYIFVPNQENNGLYIPVKKAYVMWNNNSLIGGSPIPSGTVTADVYWEDTHGLIRSGENYNLELIGSGESAKIKVPINKSKQGNAVVAYKVNGEVYWSWHIWVTDDPSNGSTYKSFNGVKRQKSDGTIELIPDADWGWMDRNLGAIGSAITGDDWIRNGGLLYQWGRKDPIPPLITKGNDAYEASGSVGRIRHRESKNWQNNAKKIDELIKYIPLSSAQVTNNIRLSVKNPLSLIYVNKDDNSGPALYNNNVDLPVNWFGTSSLAAPRLTELNLWSDNSRGFVSSNYNTDNGANPYRDKSVFDPCPNGWRVPSVLVANLGNGNYVDDVRVDFSPFGIKNNIGIDAFEANKYHIIKPNDNNTPAYMKGIKIYPNVGMDFSNVGGNNMGVFPGTGVLVRNYHEGQYTDQHETYLWTATMTRFSAAVPAVLSRNFRLIPDKDQPDVPDASLPAIKGRFHYYPLGRAQTSGTNGCRCIKDPLFKVNQYDFPTEFFKDSPEYVEGLNNPNTYTIVKNTVESIIQIPVSKAFSAQSQLLNNTDILNSSNFNDLKTNVLWSTNPGLISNVSISNPNPGSLSAISNTNINIKIAPNQSGNAVVTLHNGSITNPVYWSWHIWVTNTPISSVTYITDLPAAEAPNYVNYLRTSAALSTEIMDRNLGAIETFPTITGDNLNPETQSGAADQIILSGGLHYQWGRKDPFPTYKPAYIASSQFPMYYNNAVKYYTGTVNSSGTVSYTSLSESAFNANYTKAYNTYSASANVLPTDKPNDKAAKVLAYSVKNPLEFMIPSTISPYDPQPNGTGRYTNGSDWLSPDPNLAADRWGRGGKKSPFDPCPEGWRIPDYTNSEPNGGYGVSPWYKKGLGIGIDNNPLINSYLGTRVRVAKSVNAGFMFNNSSYQIGNYTTFIGTRGIRNVETNDVPNYNFVNGMYSLFWSGALNSNYRGRPIGYLFQINNSAPEKNFFTPYNDRNDPYFGASCRCVKVKYDNNGNEQGPIPKLPVANVLAGKAGNVFTKSVINEKIVNNKFEVFPNPVKNRLYIKSNDCKEYYYQVYNMSGQLVKSGKFENEQTDLSNLPMGAYLIRINNSENIVKIIKE
ncbi:T9SS C-terminal target domain-containing protein [Chryseobacterium sp. G0186]|uniref:T9SS type A sorting domain-containing protein n=1 Tax=Chryseobacterium sp. G0186 TaxID=2487064 RepID=UPI000F4F419A|nr:T9SS type A sorting domain-containing protein [Chryseobacterium sp. G0186]AZA78288.1 T9SS C-terminal target domain-containing protein [Chryseobacterium sp. G0186]